MPWCLDTPLRSPFPFTDPCAKMPIRGHGDGKNDCNDSRRIDCHPGLESGPGEPMRESAEARGAVKSIRAPRGTAISCKSWQQEAALRMLMNNLDPEVAERPEDLVVYGGTGKAARNWECYHAIVRALRALENDETLLVQSG